MTCNPDFIFDGWIHNLFLKQFSYKRLNYERFFKARMWYRNDTPFKAD